MRARALLALLLTAAVPRLRRFRHGHHGQRDLLGHVRVAGAALGDQHFTLAHADCLELPGGGLIADAWNGPDCSRRCTADAAPGEARRTARVSIIRMATATGSGTTWWPRGPSSETACAAGSGGLTTGHGLFAMRGVRVEVDGQGMRLRPAGGVAAQPTAATLTCGLNEIRDRTAPNPPGDSAEPHVLQGLSTFLGDTDSGPPADPPPMRTPVLRALIGAAAMLLGVVATASAVTPFAPRYSTNAAGDIAIIGNTALQCPLAVASCPGVLAGANGINNSYDMAYVDTDSNAGTFDSSSATLAMPADAQVLFAGLYWGGRRTGGTNGADAPTPVSRTSVQLQVPGGSYATVTGAETGTYTSGSETSYQAFADVTSQVTAAGNGSYTLANIQLGTGQNTYGGWSLVVVYRDDAASPRNLSVFDGFAVVNNTNPTETITVSGMQAPPSGAVTARVGVVAYDGDRGSTGDTMKLNGTSLSDAEHPANDMFNSSFANQGVRYTAKSPDYANSLGMDASVFTADGLIPNSATSATIDLATGGETYLPGVVTSAIDLYAPRLVVSKSVSDVNGGQLLAGDTLEYTISVGNTGTDAASNVVLSDVIPTGTTLVPGSLRITAGDGSGTLTDGSGDDRGDASASGITVRLGSGASSSAGGSLAINATTTAVFRVKVNADTAAGTAITNRAEAAHNAQTSGISLLARSSTESITVQSPTPSDGSPAPAPGAATPKSSARLSITISGPKVLNAGVSGNYVVTVRSVGPATATNVQLRIPIPAGMTVTHLPAGFRVVKGVAIGPKVTMRKGSSRRVVLGLSPTAAAAVHGSVKLTASAKGAKVKTVQDRTPVRVLPAAKAAPAVTG